MIVPYALMFLISMLVLDYGKIIPHARSRTLSRFMPAYDYLFKFAQGEEQLDRKKIEQYKDYYKIITQFRPDLPESYGLLGFCYYHLGEHKKAVENYKRAIAGNSGFINYYYNLGVISLLKGHFKEALLFFKTAVNTKIEDNLRFLSSSKLYFGLYSQRKTPDSPEFGLVEHLRQEYLSCYKAIVLCSHYLGNFPQVINYSKIALSKGFGDPEFFCYLAGTAAYQQKDYHAAIDFLEKIVQVNPKDVKALYYLGLSYQDLGQRDQAAKAFQDMTRARDSKDAAFDQEKKFVLQLY